MTIVGAYLALSQDGHLIMGGSLHVKSLLNGGPFGFSLALSHTASYISTGEWSTTGDVSSHLKFQDVAMTKSVIVISSSLNPVLLWMSAIWSINEV